MNKKITAAFLALLTLGMVGTAAGQLADDNPPTGDDEKQNEATNVTVDVASTTEIEVAPDTLDYSSVDVGTQDEDSERGFGSVEITNIGSEYIDRVWAEATAPDSDGFATGNASQYNAGNFIQIKPNNATEKASVQGNNSVYNYVNRYEYGDYWDSEQGSIPSYIDATPSEMLGGSAGDAVVGQFRSGDEWYFWVIPTSNGPSSATCDGNGNQQIRVGNTPHTANQFGTYDFTDDGPADSAPDYTNYTLTTSTSSSPAYGITDGTTNGVNLTFNGNERFYDVLTVCDEGEVDQAHTVRTRYNPTAATAEDLEGNGKAEAAQFLLSADSTTPSEMLLPGEGIAIDTAVEVPQGVAQGAVTEGQLTLYVTSDVDADVTN